jgi:hypothetical protein
MKRTLTNTVAALALLAAASGAVAAPLLAVDINDRTAADAPTNSVTGFSSFILADTTTSTAAVSTPTSRTIGAYTVTLAPFDDNLDENSVTAGDQLNVGQLDDRDRTTPADAGAFTYAQIYDDLVFAGVTTGPTGGMNLTVAGGDLLPNTQYLVSLYTFDSGSTPEPQPRTANWLDGNNANALVTTTSFSGGAHPTANDQYRFTGLATTDANGALLLLGRNTTANAAAGGVSIGVILNGFEVNVVPEPASLSLLTLAALPLLRRRRP